MLEASYFLLLPLPDLSADSPGALSKPSLGSPRSADVAALQSLAEDHPSAGGWLFQGAAKALCRPDPDSHVAACPGPWCRHDWLQREEGPGLFLLAATSGEPWSFSDK